MNLAGKKILVGITGSIAAYKSILLVRLLVKAGAEVKVIQTTASKDFVSPLVLSTLSKNPVLSDLSEGEAWANHVMLGRWADLMVIAPLSCNTLSKMATGACDNLIMAVYLSATCPVMVCPAMDEDMWLHPTTRRNLTVLMNDGITVMPVGHGELGSGLVGEGRMAEPEDILASIGSKILFHTRGLEGKLAMVTAGPTYEPIDPVRFIGNHSSGKMGVAIADALYEAGADVTLILGPSTAIPKNSQVNVVHVTTANEMFDAVKAVFPSIDIGVYAAAVADYRPENIFESKWKKEGVALPPTIKLIENPDILKYCGEHKKDDQFLVGFALETDNEDENALKKLKSKKADMLVLNSLRDEGAGFGTITNKIAIFDKKGEKKIFPLLKKTEVATEIVNAIIAGLS
jgi:phosphopantothenoylcysteine decarboxylase / phosphopantothenate---cysteine ligase